MFKNVYFRVDSIRYLKPEKQPLPSTYAYKTIVHMLETDHGHKPNSSHTSPTPTPWYFTVSEPVG